MALLSLCVMAVWTLVVLRLLAMRATLSMRTYFTYLLVGAMIGPFAAPVALKFLSPYGWSGTDLSFPITLLVHFLIFVPVWRRLFSRRAPAGTSIADAFLLSFMVGFGYDLVGYTLAAAYGTDVSKLLAWLPPGTLSGNGFTVVGYGYWTALPAVGIAAGLAFWRRRWPSIGIGAVLMMVAAAEHAGMSLPPEKALGKVWEIMMHGSLTPWVVLAALIVFSVWEARRAGRVGEEEIPRFAFLDEWRQMLNALSERNWAEYRRLANTFRLRRQAALLRVELAGGAGDERVRRIAQTVEEQLQHPQPDPATTTARWWRRRWQVGILALFLVFLMLPMLPAGVGDHFWTLPVVQFLIPNLQVTLFCFLLAALLLKRFVAAPLRPFRRSDPDDSIRFSGERIILQASVAAVILALVYGPAEQLYLPGGILMQFFPFATNFDHSKLTTWMLLSSAAYTGIVLPRGDRWRAAPLRLRQNSVVRNTLAAGVATLGAWACLVFFAQGQALMHAKFGASLFTHFGANGNSAGDLLVAVLTVGFSYGVFALLLSLSRRVQDFFQDDIRRAQPPPAPAHGTGE